MNFMKKNFSISIIPFLVVAWGIFMYTFFDPFYSKSIDPEFPYLVNGLNCAILKFNFIGHFDHPGTPFQIFIGLVIRITHLISGKGNIVNDVFARPEHYLNAISNSVLLIQAILIFAVGLIGKRRNIPFWQLATLQASCFFSSDLVWFFCRVNPDRFFMIVGLIYILIYLQHGYENHSPRKFALWSGVVMALGFATKFNFLPLLFLPLLFIGTNKNRLIYIGSGIVSFFIFIAPVITKFDDFYRFITKIFKHDGLYGGGESKVLNLQKMMDSLTEIIRLNPGFLILFIVLIVLIGIAIKKRKEGMKEFAWLFTGFLFIFTIQIIMVSKHFKNYYLAPSFVFYGFMFFSISLFLSKIIKKKNKLVIASTILPILFIVLTLLKVKTDHALISTLIGHRDKVRNFAETKISKDDYWFVEPTWEVAPYMENAMVYGISYCGHREEYLPQLMAANPNIITYEDNNEVVKLWRCSVVSLDSVVATGKNVYIYSTPGRHAPVLLQMVKNAADRNNIQLAVDTVYTDPETNSEIIRIRATNSRSNWQTGNSYPKDRKSRIEEFVQAIKNSPDWLEQVKEKAKIKNIPLDSMILLDAIYMVDIGK